LGSLGKILRVVATEAKPRRVALSCLYS